LVIPFFFPGKYPFELDHAGVGKKEARVVLGHKRAGGHLAMAFAGEIAQELVSDFV
jgi:hypothetical protein